MKGINLDTLEMIYLRRRIVQEKNFLRRIYEEWYQALVNSIPEENGSVLVKVYMK